MPRWATHETVSKQTQKESRMYLSGTVSLGLSPSNPPPPHTHTAFQKHPAVGADTQTNIYVLKADISAGLSVLRIPSMSVDTLCSWMASYSVYPDFRYLAYLQVCYD